MHYTKAIVTRGPPPVIDCSGHLQGGQRSALPLKRMTWGSSRHGAGDPPNDHRTYPAPRCPANWCTCDRGFTQQLICTEIPLCPPAFEIKDVQKRVEIISCEVGGIVEEKGHKIAKVIIDAVLKKNINFKTMLKDCPDDNDFDRHGKKDDDVLAPGETRVRCGDLRACFV